MRTIETYEPAITEYPGGHRWPALALMEDGDGFRWLLAAAGAAPETHWRRAVAAGAAAILAPGVGVAPAATGWYAASIEHYSAAAQVTADPLLAVGTPYDHIPALLELQAAEAHLSLPTLGDGFVSLHTHTENSPVDAVSRIPDLVRAAAAFGAPALGITDHGYVTGHPDLQTHALAAGLNPVFGLEAYFVDDVAARGNQFDYWHLILLAEDDEGLRNLWALSTASWRDGFYGKPRMDWPMLARHSKGLIATTACLGGPIAQAIMADDTVAAQGRLARLGEIFGRNLLIELHGNGAPEQKPVNEELVRLARAHDVGLIAAADSHYTTPADADLHRAWLACATNSTIDDDSGMFQAGSGPFHLHDAAQMRSALSYLPEDAVQEALATTVRIGQQAAARIATRKALPLYSRSRQVDDDVAELRRLAEAGWSKVAARPDQAAYRARLERELDVIIGQQFCGYFLMVADYCRWAKDNKILVGPGRGSGAACLVAYLIGITEIDPVRYNLPFERFLTPGRTSLPDFDVDFPSTMKAEILAYLRRRFGEDHVVTIGTTLRLKNKAVVAELGRAMKHELGPEAFTDLRAVADFIDEAEAGTAGLGLSWEDLWAQHGDHLQRWRAKYPRLFQTADGLVGLLKTYGRHAAGVIISTDEPLTGTLPLRAAEAGEQMISQFDDDGVEALGHVKFDILTLRTLDTVQHAVDAIEARYGRRLDVYGFNQEFDDPQVWDMICSGQVLGIFQIETSLGIQMCRRLAPRNLTELADVIALVRPGPRNSGITDAYLARRAGEQQVTVPDPRLAEVLGPTYGTIVYQEQVLAAFRTIAGYDDAQADAVRKILGKKQVEKIDAAGREFVDRATERGMPRNNALLLWEQMAEFAKYAFNLGHAYGYAVLAYWVAFLKAHFPVEFCAAVLSTVKKDRIPEFVKEARQLGVPVLPPDINTSKIGFTIDGRSVRYGVDSLKGIGDKAAQEIVTHAPYTSVADLSERTGSAVNAGTIRLLARAGAFDSLPGEPHRAAILALLDPEADKESKRCVDRLDDEQVDGGEEEGVLPCRFDWASEPPPINPKNGKKLKPRPAPKKCTVRCRQYRPTGTRDVSLVAPFTPAQIGEIELDMLGMYLSWTPFGRIPPEHADLRRQYREQADRAASGAPGTYTVLALVARAKPHTSRGGLSMGFVTLTTEGPDLDTACMSKLWGRIEPATLPGAMVLAQVQRTERGLTLLELGRW